MTKFPKTRIPRSISTLAWISALFLTACSPQYAEDAELPPQEAPSSTTAPEEPESQRPGEAGMPAFVDGAAFRDGYAPDEDEADEADVDEDEQEDEEDQDAIPEPPEEEQAEDAQVPPTWNGDLTVSTDVMIGALCAGGFTRVDGSLRVNDSVTSVAGLSCLERVAGDLSIVGAPGLAAISPFPNLVQVGGSVTIAGLPALDWQEPFPALGEIGGSLVIESLRDVRIIDGFAALELIGGDLAIRDNASVETISMGEALGEVGGAVELVWNPEAIKVGSLDGLSMIGGDLVVEGMRALTELPRMSALDAVGGLEIIDNDRLEDIGAASAIGAIDGDVRIEQNKQLSIAAIEEFVTANAAAIAGTISVSDNGEEDPAE